MYHSYKISSWLLLQSIILITYPVHMFYCYLILLNQCCTEVNDLLTVTASEMVIVTNTNNGYMYYTQTLHTICDNMFEGKTFMLFVDFH